MNVHILPSDTLIPAGAGTSNSSNNGNNNTGRDRSSSAVDDDEDEIFVVTPASVRKRRQQRRKQTSAYGFGQGHALIVGTILPLFASEKSHDPCSYSSYSPHAKALDALPSFAGFQQEPTRHDRDRERDRGPISSKKEREQTALGFTSHSNLLRALAASFPYEDLPPLSPVNVSESRPTELKQLTAQALKLLGAYHTSARLFLTIKPPRNTCIEYLHVEKESPLSPLNGTLKGTVKGIPQIQVDTLKNVQLDSLENVMSVNDVRVQRYLSVLCLMLGNDIFRVAALIEKTRIYEAAALLKNVKNVTNVTNVKNEDVSKGKGMGGGGTTIVNNNNGEEMDEKLKWDIIVRLREVILRLIDSTGRPSKIANTNANNASASVSPSPLLFTCLDLWLARCTYVSRPLRVGVMSFEDGAAVVEVQVHGGNMLLQVSPSLSLSQGQF